MQIELFAVSDAILLGKGAGANMAKVTVNVWGKVMFYNSRKI